MPITLKLKGEAKQPAKSAVFKLKEKLPFLPDNATESADPQPPATVGQDRKILVVDDNPVVLKAFELKLKACGFEVSTTSNAAGVASIAEASGAELIILDINFPPGVALDWSGFTVMQWLRRFPELARIPVILISGDGSENNQQKSLTGGAVAFFQKPVPYPELLATIVRALRSPA